MFQPLEPPSSISLPAIESESKDAEPSDIAVSDSEPISAATRLAELTPSLGMSFRQIRSSGLSDDQFEHGLRVTGVVEFGSAHNAGILVDDIITRFDGKPTFTK